MPAYQIDRHVIHRPYVELTPYMPGLALSIAARFGFEPGQMFFADLCALITDDTHIFPADIGPAARRYRVERMLATPVQVDDIVLSLHVDGQESAYQKTKRIVATRGSLPEEEPQQDPWVLHAYCDPFVSKAAPAEASITSRLQSLESALLDMRQYTFRCLNTFKDALASAGVDPDFIDGAATRNEVRDEIKILRRQIEDYHARIEMLQHRAVQLEEHVGFTTSGLYDRS